MKIDHLFFISYEIQEGERQTRSQYYRMRVRKLSYAKM